MSLLICIIGKQRMLFSNYSLFRRVLGQAYLGWQRVIYLEAGQSLYDDESGSRASFSGTRRFCSA
jgi:hypothetical protein